MLAAFVLLALKTVNAIQVTEIMYHPQKEDSLYEFIELYNETSSKRDLSGWTVVGGINFVFPTPTIMNPKAYLVIARNPKTIMAEYQIKNVVGPFSGELKDDSDHFRLLDPAGGVMIDVEYKNRGRWPVASDGTWHSLAKISPRLNPANPENWRPSLQMGGTPGADNGFSLKTNNLKSPVVINEVFSETKGTQFIELYNRLAKPFDIGGYWLSNNLSKLKLYKVPAGTVLPAHGYVRFREKNIGFTLNSAGGRVLLTNPKVTQVVDAFAFDKTPSGMSEGCYPDGENDWYYISPSPASANSVNLNTDVVINEIMYHPPTDLDSDEYIEIYNRSSKNIDISGWSFSRGISFAFPKGTIIPAHSYLVIAKDREHLISKYGLSSRLVLGNFTGRLSNGGEKMRLRDNIGNKVDEVRYYDGGHWAEYADGYGSSLELIDPNHDNSNYQAWAASNETKKAKWVHVSYSGVYNQNFGGYWRRQNTTDELHLHLLGAGEILIDDIHLKKSKGREGRGAEYIANGSFEKGRGRWVIMGNHVQSHIINTDSKDGSKCLKIVATGRGDTGANHIEQDSSNRMTNRQTYTISFWAKWQWGSNLLVTRCFDNQISETHRIPIPKLTGTPGKKNSVSQPNLGPTFQKTRHWPVIPKPKDKVRITTYVSDPDGLKTVTLYYKADTDRSYQKTIMYDDGKHYDGAGNDGLYGGIIPNKAAGQTVAFYIQAKDSKNQSNTWPNNNPPQSPFTKGGSRINRPGLYRVEHRRMNSRYPIYRIIMAAADESKLHTRPPLSNELLNSTFIFDEKDVYYNVGCRYTGSPFGRRGGYHVGGYKVLFNEDEKLHGVKRQVRLDRNNMNDRISYHLQRQMKLPTCQQEWVYVCFNRRNDGVWEDILPPNKRYLSMFYPDDDNGQLFEVDDRFVFIDDNDRYPRQFTHHDATFQWDKTDDKDVYRWNYEIRNHERADDYTYLIQMLNIMNRTPRAKYEAAVDKIINVDEWFRLMAVRTAIADWDFFGATRGKNAYLYRPNKTGKWEVLGWDSDLTFEQAQMSIWSNFPAIRRFQRSPKHQHLYYTYIQELLDKYFTWDSLSPWVEHHYAFVGGERPYRMKSFINYRNRYLRRIIPKAEVKITTNGGKRFTVDGNTVDLAGTAPVQTRWVRVAKKDYYLDWTGATTWKFTLPLKNGKNRLVLEFLDYDKKIAGKDSIEVTAKNSSGTEIANPFSSSFRPE